MLPFDDMHPMYGRGLSMSYGVDESAPPTTGTEGAEGAEGGAQNGAVAAGVLNGIAAVGAVIIGGITTAVVTEASVYMNVERFQNKLGKRLTKLNSLNRTTRNYRLWLRDPGNRAQWQNGPAARNAVRANNKRCPPIYEGTGLTHVQTSHRLSCGSQGKQSDCTAGCTRGAAAPSGWHKIPGTSLRPSYNPGGHKCGDAGCHCPTHACAFKDPAKATRYKLWLKKGPFHGWGGAWFDNRPPALAGWGVERLLAWCQDAWSYLMTVAPAERLYNSTPGASPFSVNDSLLASPDVLSVVWPDLDGQIPLAMQIHWWNSIKEIHHLGLPAWGNDQEVPYFVFGFTEEEIREQMPDGLIRAGLFSVKALLDMQRLYTVKYLASQGVPGYAGVSYGQDTEAEGVPTDTMKELIFAAYDEIKAGATPESAADTATSKHHHLPPDHPLRAWRGKKKKKLPFTPDDPPPVVNPNYLPLAAGGVALLTSLLLRNTR